MNNLGETQTEVPIAPVQQLVEQPAVLEPEGFLSTVGGLTGDVADTFSNVSGNFRDLAQTYAPSVFGDSKNREIAERAKQANQ